MQPKTFTVTQASRLIKNAIDVEMLLKSIAIVGEISNLKYHGTGHVYFSLKDESNVLSCVMFKRHADYLPYKLENGLEVMAIGEINFYEKNGTITLNCEAVLPKGQGLQNLQLEQLKEKLRLEGMFALDKKLKLPKYPEKVAVITSKTGAVIEDIKKVAGRRNKGVEILLCPVKVQGEGAENEIVSAINYVNKNKLADVIIIARGGGSKEDLNAFNNESVVRAVFSSKIPTVSAVGHETDTSLCDLVASVWAATPSEAAELVFPSTDEMKNLLWLFESRFNEVVDSRISIQKERLRHIAEYEIYNKAMFLIKQNQSEISRSHSVLNNTVNLKLMENKNDLNVKMAKIEKYNPIDILKQGYSLVYKNNKVIESTDKLDVGDIIKVELKKGKVEAKITDIN